MSVEKALLTKQTKTAGGVSDEAVRKKTGKGWDEWFALLDKAGAAKMNHAEIAVHLAQKHDCSAWWSQMITVGYEQERGRREKHEKPDGYQISRSKTIAVPVERMFAAMDDAKQRRQWLKDKIVIRKATAFQSMRITWSDGTSSLEVNFYPKGVNKSQIVVQHSKLLDAKAGEQMKQFWTEALDRLKSMLTPDS